MTEAALHDLLAINLRHLAAAEARGDERLAGMFTTPPDARSPAAACDGSPGGQAPASIKDQAMSDDAPIDDKVISYKGFDKDFRCRDHQFEVGKTYTVSGMIKTCSNGFHACANPWDVWSYYPIIADDASLNRYATVEQSGALDRHDKDRKIASATITIQAELRLPDFIKRAVSWIVDPTKKGAEPHADDGNHARIGSSGNDAQIGSSGNDAQIGSSGYYAQIGSSGYYARIGSSGYYAQIGSSGNDAQIGSSGNDARIGSSGYAARIGSSGDAARIGSSGNDARIGSSGYAARIGSSGNDAQIGSSGNDAQIGSSGDDAQIGSSGDDAQIGSSGYAARIGSSGNDAQIGSSGYHARIGSSGYAARIGSSGDHARIGSSGYAARIGSSGDHAQIDTSGESAVIASAGCEARVKGAVGAWVSLAEYDADGSCVGFATGRIGHDGILADTWLRASNGKLIPT